MPVLDWIHVEIQGAIDFLEKYYFVKKFFHDFIPGFHSLTLCLSMPEVKFEIHTILTIKKNFM